MARAAEDRPLTAEDLAALPDDELRLELVAGFLVSEPPPSWSHGEVAARLVQALRVFVSTEKLGSVVSNDTGFVLARAPDTVRAPDVAFVSKERLKQAGEVKVYFPGPPDLAIEVRSPGDRPGEIHAKVADYLVAGTRLVWVVDPAAQRVTVYRSLLHPRTLSSEDQLEGEDVLPGFALEISEIFED